jgi:hypothetical protein
MSAVYGIPRAGTSSDKTIRWGLFVVHSLEESSFNIMEAINYVRNISCSRE